MNVLLPLKILSEKANRNHFSSSLLEAVLASGEGVTVDYGSDWKDQLLTKSYDIINIHWPELIPVQGEEEQSKLGEFLIEAKGPARIAFTVHNLLPHGGKPEGSGQKLYDNLISMSDTFIHFSASARDIFIAEYGKLLKPGSTHQIIMHGNYTFLPDTVTRTQAREKLSIAAHKQVYLSFGAHRSIREITLLLSALVQARVKGKMLIVAGRIEFGGRRHPGRYLLKRFFRLLHSANLVRFYGGGIAHDEIQHFLRASDALIIPRFHTLNSGNLYLGLTFGVPVIAPDYATCLDVCNATGNFLYETGSPASLAAAMKRVSALNPAERRRLQSANKAFAKEQLNWDEIGQQYIKAFESCLATK